MLAEFNSDEAVGSAFNEAMKSAESWEGQLNSVSNSWTELISRVIQSDDAINVLKTIDDIIQDLSDSKTISGLGSIANVIVGLIGAIGNVADWAGVVPTITTVIGTISAFKGKNFITFIRELNSAKPNIKEIIQTLSLAKNIKGTYKDFGINLTGFNTDDINSLQSYIDLLDEGVDSSAAFTATMVDASDNVKNQAKSFANLNNAYKNGQVSAQDYTVATKNLATAQKVTTTTSKALSTALNLVANVGIAVAISLITKGIEYLATESERASEKMKEFVDNVQEANSKIQEEEEFLNGIIDKYTELYASTNDLTSIKQDLSKLQDELINKYGDEAEAIDLINQKYSENIKLINEQRKIEAEQYLRDEAANIEASQGIVDGSSKISSSIKMKAKDSLNLSYDELDNIKKIIEETTGLSGGIASDIFGTEFIISQGTYKEQIDSLNALAEAYIKTNEYSQEFYNAIISKRKEVENALKEAENQVARATYESALLGSDKDAQEYYNILDKLTLKYQEINNLKDNGGSLFEIQSAEQEALELKNAAMEFANNNSVLREQVSNIVKTVGKETADNLSDVSVSFDTLEQDFQDFLKGEGFDTAISQIDKIKSAMQTLASGELLEWSDASELMFDIDTERVLGDFEEIDGKYRLIGNDITSLITLKDQLIKKQIEEVEGERERQKAALETKRIELETARQQLSRSNSASDAKYWNNQISDIESEMKSINSLTRDYNYLIKHLNSQLGNTVDLVSALEERMKKIQENADKYADAMLNQVSDIIDKHESEKDILEKEKESLEEQLSVLEEQKDELEEIIDNYKTVADVVESVTEKEIDLLKEQQEAQEEVIQAKIDALKEAREQQEEENDLIEKELTLQQKLRDLEKAKQTKVRTYSESRGWHHGTDKEAVANAQTAVNEAQADYDKAIDEKLFNDQIEALEKEKELITESFEEQIKAYEDYYEQWKEILDEQTNAENEQLAQQILGVEWREKIKKKDTEILNKFSSNLKNYNSQLSRLVNNEIDNLNKSIKAKEKEIKAKDEQIQSWKDYQSQVEKTINSVKNKYDEYLSCLDEVNLSESSSYEDRANALADFKNTYQGYIDEINNLQGQLGDLSTGLYIETNLQDVSYEMAEFIYAYSDAIQVMQERLDNWDGSQPVNSEWDAKLADAANIFRAISGYSTGGTADYTGLAMLHGTKSAAETIFNAQQSKQLYDMVRTGNFSQLVAQKAIDGLKTAIKPNQINNSTNDSKVINIQEMVIKSDNPTQFHDQFMKEIGQYWRVELAESRVK